MLQISAGAVLSLLVTIFVGVLFVIMLSETIALGKGRDPLTNLIGSVMRLSAIQLRRRRRHRKAARPPLLDLIRVGVTFTP